MIRPVAAFSIRVASRMSGLSPELLRAWERRHGVVRPLRAPNGRRLYSKSDVEHLRLLKSAVDAGHPIGNVCGLPREDLRGLGALEDAAPVRLAVDPHSDLDHLAATLAPREFVLQVAAPLQGKPVAGAAARHICASLLRTLRRAGPPDMLVAGAAILPAVLAAAHGRRVVYVGSDVAPAEIAQLALDAAIPTALIQSDSVHEIEQLVDELPPQVEVWVMGRAAQDAPSFATPLSDLAELDRELS